MYKDAWKKKKQKKLQEYFQVEVCSIPLLE